MLWIRCEVRQGEASGIVDNRERISTVDVGKLHLKGKERNRENGCSVRKRRKGCVTEWKLARKWSKFPNVYCGMDGRGQEKRSTVRKVVLKGREKLKKERL